MSIVERRDSTGRRRFHARVHIGGGRYTYGPVRDTEKAAKIDEGDLLKQPVRRKQQTVAELCDWFELTYPERPRPRTGRIPRDSTVQTARHAIRPFRSAFGSLRPAELSREDLKAFLAERPWAAQAVKTMFSDAIDSELCDRNPLAGIAVKKSRGRADIEVPTVEEVHDLADCALRAHGTYGPTFRAMLLWFAYTGMRPGEVFALEHGDIEGDTIRVRRNLGRTGIVTLPKNGKPRTIILPDVARQALGEMSRLLGVDLVFTSKRGNRMSEGSLGTYWRPVKAAFIEKLNERRRQALDPPGTPLHPYSLRHFCATYLLSLGLYPWDVAEQLGHTDGGDLVTKRYGHPRSEDTRERIRRALNPAPVTELRSTDRKAENG